MRLWLGLKLLWNLVRRRKREVRASWLELITVCFCVSLIPFLLCLSDKALSSASWINCVPLLTERTAELWMKHWASITRVQVLIIVNFLFGGKVRLKRFGRRFHFLCRYTWKNNETSLCVLPFINKTAAWRSAWELQEKEDDGIFKLLLKQRCILSTRPCRLG